LNRLITSLILILYTQSAFSYYLEYDRSSSTSKVISIRNIFSLDSGCELRTIEGVITKITKVNFMLEVDMSTNKGSDGFFLDIKEFSMSELRSLNPILSVNEKVRVEGQVCGSGGIFYPVNIIDLGKNKTFRGWVDDSLNKFGFQK
jgi:hypothetical protein